MQPKGLSLAALQASLRGRRRGNCQTAEVGLAQTRADAGRAECRARTGYWAGSVARIPASEIENRVARAVGRHLAGRASAIDGRHINHGVRGGDQAIPQLEPTRRLREDPPTEKDVRNAIERATVGATRIEILPSESVVAEGQDRVLTQSFRCAASGPVGRRLGVGENSRRSAARPFMRMKCSSAAALGHIAGVL